MSVGNTEGSSELTYDERVAALKDAVSDGKLNSITGADSLKEVWTEGLKKALDNQLHHGVRRTELDEAVTITLEDASPNEPGNILFFNEFCRMLNITPITPMGADASRSLLSLDQLNASSDGSVLRCTTKIDKVAAEINYQKPKQGDYGNHLTLALNIRK